MLELILSSIGTIIANIIIFLSIPFLWWLIKYRKSISFFEWVGLIKDYYYFCCSLLFFLFV